MGAKGSKPARSGKGNVTRKISASSKKSPSPKKSASPKDIPQESSNIDTPLSRMMFSPTKEQYQAIEEGVGGTPGLLCNTPYDYPSIFHRDKKTGRPLGIYTILFCKPCKPADPDEKVVRDNIPYMCYKEWEINKMMKETTNKKAAEARESVEELVLDDPRVTWDLVEKAVKDADKSPYPAKMLSTKNGEVYAFLHVKSIRNKGNKTIKKGGKEGRPYPLWSFFNKRIYDLMKYCNNTYDTSTIFNRLGDGFTVFLVLRKKAGGTITVAGFLTMMIQEHRWYVGDVCIATKRSGLGKVVIEQIKEMIKKSEADYIELEPADGSEEFYEKLGFSLTPDPRGRDHLIWCKPGATADVCVTPANKKGSGSKNDS